MLKLHHGRTTLTSPPLSLNGFQIEKINRLVRDWVKPVPPTTSVVQFTQDMLINTVNKKSQAGSYGFCVSVIFLRKDTI